jgi:hypothetical protein
MVCVDRGSVYIPNLYIPKLLAVNFTFNRCLDASQIFWSARHMTWVPKQVYTVLGLQGPKFQIFTAKFYKPLFRSILSKSAHFSKSFGCLAASKQAQSFR